MKKPLLPLFRLVVILLCLLQSDLSAQTLGWVKQLGGIAEDNVSDMEVDKDGNIFITGTFDYIADFDPGPNEFLLTSKGLSDVFIAKYDSLGNFVWANQFGSSVNEFQTAGQNVELDYSGNVYVTLATELYSATEIYQTRDTTIALKLLKSATNNFVIVKFDNFGSFSSLKQFSCELGNFSFDADDNLFMVCRSFTPIITSNGVLVDTINLEHGEYLIKFVKILQHNSVTKIGNILGKSYTNMSFDLSGNLFVMSHFENVIELTVNGLSTKLVAVNYADMIISKVSPNGKIVWSKQIVGEVGSEAVYTNLVLDSKGNCIVGGLFSNRIIVDPPQTSHYLLVCDNCSFGTFLCKIANDGIILKLLDVSKGGKTGRIISDKENIKFLRTSTFLGKSEAYDSLYHYDVDFNLIKTSQIRFSRPGAYYKTKLLINGTELLYCGTFYNKFDFDPSCREKILNSYLTSGDIAVLKLRLDQNQPDTNRIYGEKEICLGDTLYLSIPTSNQYIWSTGDKTQTIKFVPSLAGKVDFWVEVPGLDSCPVRHIFSTIVNAVPNLISRANPAICLGQSTKLVATRATSYAWSTGQTDSTIVVQPVVSTTYTLTLTNANGCSAVDTILVKVNPLPKANAGVDQSICVGDSATLEASGGTQYYWNNLKLQAKQVVKPTTTTNYSVVVTDGNGCAATDEVVVNVYPNPDVDLLGIDTLKLKVGQFVILYAGKGQKFLWNTGDTANTIIIDQKSGNYCVTVTSAFGCQGSDCLFVQFTPTANQEVGAATVNIYPNPAQEFLTIAVHNSTVLPYDLQLFNALGQSVKQVNHITMDQQNLDITDLAAGNYFVHLRFEGYTVVEQVVVRNQ